MSKYVQPSLERRSFTCPRCGVVCPQDLNKIKLSNQTGYLSAVKTPNEIYVDEENSAIAVLQEENIPIDEKWGWHLFITVCSECKKYAIWENKKMIFPIITDMPELAADMPEDVKRIYNEAALVFKHSPRSAAALVRLAIETLIPQLPDYQITKKQLVGMIGELVAQGIPKHIQQALDGIRLYGNQGIHTAEIISEDDGEVSVFLFALINRIVRELITDKKEIDAFYNSFPASKLEVITQRDNS